jgi:serine/threonine protein kinase
VKISDFGMAAKLKKGETIQKVAGTIGFMAPEII